MFVMEKLIACIKKYPCLYDMGDEMYKNTALKAEIWEAIAKELEENACLLKTKWKNLRDNYVRYKKVKGSGTRQASRKHKWRWFSQLQFLDSTLDSRSTSPDLAQTSKNTSLHVTLAPAPASHESSSSSWLPSNPMQSTVSASTSFAPPVVAPPVVAPKPVKQPKRIHESSELEDETGYQKTKNHQQFDAIDHLFQSYADTFKKFTEKNKIMVKLEMAKLFADTEMKELNERFPPADPPNDIHPHSNDTLYPVSPCCHSSCAHGDHQCGSHTSAASSTLLNDIKLEMYQCNPGPSDSTQ